MPDYLEYPATHAATLENSRRGLLTGFGVLALVISAVTLGFAGLVAYNLWRWVGIRQFALPPGMIAGMAAGVALLFFVAAGIGWLAVGMIRCRRWVLAAGQAMSVLALGTGLVLTELAAAEFIIEEKLTPGGTGEAGMAAIAVAVLVLVGIVIPAGYLVLFRRANVRRTLEHYDPYPVWTDRFTHPVLVAAVASFYFGLIAITWIGSPNIPFFGRYVTGWRVVFIAIAWAGLLFATSAACASRRPIGWWLAMATCVLFPASLLLTFWRADVHALYGADLHIVDSDSYVATKLKQWPLERINHTFLCLLCGATALSYLRRTRPAFIRPAPPPTATAFTPPVDVPAVPRILTPDDPPAD